MLQRQIMFKQFQEMQRRQQLQDTGEGRKPNYVNQLGSLKQASGTQFPQPNNGATINDMFMFGNNNMDMVQHSGSANFQGFGNGLSMSQPQNLSVHPLGFSQPQFGVPLYSHLQGPSNDNANLLAYGNSVIGQRSNFSSDQICFPEGSLLPNPVLEEKNLFGQSLVQGFNDGNLQPRNTSNLESKVSVCTSLDPLEQKILFNTDGNAEAGGLTSTLDLTSYMDELPSLQSGSWSALMQSAVAETSSDQKNWPSSKPEPLYQNYGFPGFQQPVEQYGKQRDDSHSESSHSSVQQSPRNTNKWSSSSDYSPQQRQTVEGSQIVQTSSPLPGFWPGQHHENPKNDTDQSSFPSYANMNRPFCGLSGHESRGKLHGSTTQLATGGSQKPFDQSYNQRYSMESAKLTPGSSFVPTSSLFGSLSHPHVQSGTAQTSESMLDLLNKDDISIEHPSGNCNPNESTQKEVPLAETSSFGKSYNTSSVTQGFCLRLGPADQQTPQPLSFFQTFSGNSSETSPSSNLASKFPLYNSAISQDNGPLKQSAHLFDQELPILGSVPVAQPSMTLGLPQHVGLPAGPSNVWPDLFRSSDLALSSLQHSQKQESTVEEYNAFSGKSDGQELRPGKDGQHQYGLTTMGPSIPQSRSTHEQEITNMAQQRGNQTPYNSLHQNNPFNHPVQTSLKPNRTEKNDAFSSVNDKTNTMFGQNGTQTPLIGSNEGSNMTYQSQISLQMAPSWFKHYGTLNNEQMRPPPFDANAATNTAHQVSGRTSLPMQVNLGGQGSATWQIKQLSPANVSPSNIPYQNLAASRPKKRKFVALELTPWHKEVTQNSGRLQNISTAELEWAQATNKIFEEVKMEAVVLEDINPVVRAKRRLVFTTQLMQQIFRPPPTAILSADASLNYDFMVYFAARLTLGDACSLASNPQIPSDGSSEKSSEKPKTSKRAGAYGFSKIAEGLTSQMKMLKDNMLRLEKGLSIMDIKAEAQDLEKFSTINRMAKFHGRAHQGVVDGASSSNTTQKLIQRYVIAVPMPRTIPDGANCLSL